MFTQHRHVFISESSQTEELQLGDVVDARVRTFEWTKLHLRGSQLEPWRQRCDSLADAALAALPTLPSSSTCTTSAPFDLIQHHIHSTPTDERHPDVVAFWEEITRLPPLPGDMGDKTQGRERARELVEAGQQVYTTYSGPISFALLYYSLAGGFSSPRITRVLELTSYLLPKRPGQVTAPPTGSRNLAAPVTPSTSASDERTFERLGETAQWAMACMDNWESVTPPEDPSRPFEPAPPKGRTTVRPRRGEAWADTVRVRLIHAQMRARVLARGRDGSYETEKDGVPLNVEDMAATLASFAVAPVWCLRKMGLSLTAHEREGYLALWRHLGFYLGVPLDILDAHFGAWAPAEAFADSVIIHLFTFPDNPEVAARLPTIPVLRAVAVRGGIGAAMRPLTEKDQRIGYHLAISRALLGEELGAAIGLPAPGWADALRVRAIFLTMAAPIWFGRVWRRGWERRRTECIRRALPRVVAWSLGRRRTTFWAGPVKGVSVKDGDKRWEKIDPDAAEWVAEGEWITQNWSVMWREMVSVLGGAAVLGALSTAWIWSAFLQYTPRQMADGVRLETADGWAPSVFPSVGA